MQLNLLNLKFRINLMIRNIKIWHKIKAYAKNFSSMQKLNFHHSNFQHLPTHWPKQPVVKLNNGQIMPKIGLGTAVSDHQQLKVAIKDAIINVGYRHLDTAKAYENQTAVGEGIKMALESRQAKEIYNITRQDLFVTTKLTLFEKKDPQQALRRSLQRLNLEYVDLYLIHWPATKYDPLTDTWQRIPLAETWKALQNLQKQNLTKSIGISNFGVQLTADLLTYCEIKPVVHQSELHPYFSNIEMVEWLKRVDIQPVAAAPLGAPGTAGSIPRMLDKTLLKNKIVRRMAKKYCKTEAQIILAWSLQRGHVIIPKSTIKYEYSKNFESFDFGITFEDMVVLNGLDRGLRCFDINLYAKHGNIPIFK